MADIMTRIDSFYGHINPEEGGPDTRYKSWEWCHTAFLEGKKKYKHDLTEAEKNQIVEDLSLHLAFYLASWGMYRGRSFLLQRDYKAHKGVVKAILEVETNILWDYRPQKKDIKKAKNELFGKDNKSGIYYTIKKAYGEGYKASDTLTTKILLGTFGCVPAFDRFFKAGVDVYNKTHKIDKKKKFTSSIEKTEDNTFENLAQFAIKHSKELNKIKDYPPMKCVDMYFWQLGYELDLANKFIDIHITDPEKNQDLKTKIQDKICEITLEEAKDLVMKNK